MPRTPYLETQCVHGAGGGAGAGTHSVVIQGAKLTYSVVLSLQIFGCSVGLVSPLSIPM